MGDYKIIEAEYEHLEQIRDIMNYSILNSNYNFNFEAKTIEEIEDWYIEHENRNLPIMVCIDANNNIVTGWASLSPFRDFEAYNTTSEISVYVKEEYKQKGIGKNLIICIEEEGINKGLHSIVSVITGGNKASIELHKKMGYEIKGIFEEIGYKNKEFLDVVFMYKIIKK